MQFQVQSGRFLAELERRVSALRTDASLSASIVVPDEMSWWYIQEFGTVDRYPIGPVIAPELVFPDENGGEPIRTKHVDHPPIVARHMITSVLDDINSVVSAKAM